MHLSGIIALFQKLDADEKMLPGTNAVSERSFSSLNRIKTYLRSTTTNDRLNDLLIFIIHKIFTDGLDLTKFMDEFIERREGRKSKL